MAGLAGAAAYVLVASIIPPVGEPAVENFEVSTFLPYESCAGATGFRVLGTNCQPQVAMVDNLSIQFLSTNEDTAMPDAAGAARPAARN